MKYIYFDADNLSLFIDWLRQHPTNDYTVIIGSDPLREVSAIVWLVFLEDQALAAWLEDSLRTGEIRMIIIPKETGFPQGLEFGPDSVFPNSLSNPPQD